MIDVKAGTFSIEEDKLSDIHDLCAGAFLRDFMTKREFQLLLGNCFI